MLTYLIGSVRPELQMTMHQGVRFNNNSEWLHEQAVMRIGSYFLGLMDHGIVYSPDPFKGVEVYVDADFAGMWDPDNASRADIGYSCTKFTIRYVKCPVFLQSKLQIEVDISTA